MRLTVLGACGAWPGAGLACSGYVVEHDGFRLLLDPGYATLPRLLTHMDAADVDAVAVTHGHPDHCADLNPLLRSRALASRPAPPLPVYAPPGSLDAVLALDRPGMLSHAYTWHELNADETVPIGPFRLRTRLLPHYVPNLGMRIEAGGRVLAYTGDTGPSAGIVALARGADLLLAESTYADEVPAPDAAFLSSARQAGQAAADAGAARLLLTHLWPGQDAWLARHRAAEVYTGWLDCADPSQIIDL
jgi:ribonuclease BN (tRNA processing enzyme)